MGGSTSFGVAFAKAQLAVGQRLPERGTAFISVNNEDKVNEGRPNVADEIVNRTVDLVINAGIAAGSL